VGSVNTGAEDRGTLKNDLVSVKSGWPRPRVAHTRRVHLHPPTPSRRLARLATGVFAGAVIGATIGWAAAGAAAVAGDGAGYGGNANELQVQVSGEHVHVEGAGFLAGSAVEVHIGDLIRTVTADDVGRVDAVLQATTPGADVAAIGTAPNGSPTTRSPQPTPASSHEIGTLLGGMLGAGPALLLTRKYGRQR